MRSEALPEIPTLNETLPGFEASAWIGLAVPNGVPAEIISRINREVNTVLEDAKIKVRIAELSGSPIGGAPDDFARMIAEETDKWGQVIRSANIKAE